MFKKQILACVLSIFGLLYIGSSAAATLSFSPANTTVNRGESFDVDVVISDLGGQLVGAFDFDTTFDSTALSYSGFQFSNQLGDPDPFAFETITGVAPGAGVVNAFNISLLLPFELAAIQTTPSFTLGTLSFQALDKVGLTTLSLLNVVIADDLGFTIGTQTVEGKVNVVPVPGAIWLMLSGLIGIRALARKKKAATS